MTEQLRSPGGEPPEAAVVESQRVRQVRRTGYALAVVVVVLLGPIVAPMTAQPASRYALTGALADHHTVDLDRYRNVLEIDHAIYRGALRSDKGPGQPLVAVPFYLVARLVGAEPATHNRVLSNLGVWWLTLWTAVIPFALLVMLMYRAAATRAPNTALVAAISLGFGTIMLPHSVNLYAHTISALLGYGAYLVIDRRAPTRANFAFAGLLAGAAVATEYHLAIVAVVVAVVAALRHARRFTWLVVGALGPAVVLGVYQARAFGAAWHTPFGYYAGSLGGTTRGGYALPTVEGFYDVLAGNRSLLLMNPIVLVAILAAVLVLRDRLAPERREAIVALVVVGGYFLLVAGWSGTPWLEEPGPRYLIPAIPFLAVPLALGWRRLRAVARPAALWGGFFMVAAATTLILVARTDTPVNAYVNRVRDHRFLPTVWSMGLGTAGALIYVVTVTAAIMGFRRMTRADADDRAWDTV